MPMAWALYSDMNAKVCGDTYRSVDEVISPRFFIVHPRNYGLKAIIFINKQTKGRI